MKNKLSLVSLLFLLYTGLFAEKKTEFSISPYAGIRWGQQDEFVFADAANGKEYKLSELNWEQKSMYLFGITSEFRRKSFHLSLTAETSLSKLKTGKVLDKDWLNVTKSSCTDEQSYLIQTNLSDTENFLERYFRAEGTISFDVIKKAKFTFSPSAKLEYAYSQFVTRNGWFQYATSDDYGNFTSVEAMDFYNANGIYGFYTLGGKYNLSSENSMRLTRHVLCSWVGINSNIKVNPKISLDFSLDVCPYIFVFSKDNHLARNKDFIDLMDCDFSGIKLSAKLNYFFNSNQSVFFKTEYKNLSGIKGEGYVKESSEKKYKKTASSSGSAFENINFYLGLNFLF